MITVFFMLAPFFGVARNLNYSHTRGGEQPEMSHDTCSYANGERGNELRLASSSKIVDHDNKLCMKTWR